MLEDLSKSDCTKLLESEHYGHMGVHADDETYVVPVTFAHKDGKIYSYTHDGKKIRMMRLNPKVCIQVEKVISPVDWESVICWGTVEEVFDMDEKKEAGMLLAEKFALAALEDNFIYSPLVQELSAHAEGEQEFPVIFRIDIETCTGKRQLAR